jgi:hypothetical protein
MNKGILQLALSGTVALELEYREPLKETDEQFLIAQRIKGSQLQTQLEHELAFLLQLL